ncbi:hypothetical protein, conserved [Angomonas deanei]|uniref:Uncharacterized protein n=1 Tax=Angomonas deanei TaxID=59799 RepID=A0A7G2CRD7_9TRYP|nr:hypothetical protein, conserved [Angomonas deanei]
MRPAAARLRGILLRHRGGRVAAARPLVVVGHIPAGPGGAGGGLGGPFAGQYVPADPRHLPGPPAAAGAQCVPQQPVCEEYSSDIEEDDVWPQPVHWSLWDIFPRAQEEQAEAWEDRLPDSMSLQTPDASQDLPAAAGAQCVPQQPVCEEYSSDIEEDVWPQPVHWSLWDIFPRAQEEQAEAWEDRLPDSTSLQTPDTSQDLPAAAGAQCVPQQPVCEEYSSDIEEDVWPQPVHWSLWDIFPRAQEEQAEAWEDRLPDSTSLQTPDTSQDAPAAAGAQCVPQQPVCEEYSSDIEEDVWPQPVHWSLWDIFPRAQEEQAEAWEDRLPDSMSLQTPDTSQDPPAAAGAQCVPQQPVCEEDGVWQEEEETQQHHFYFPAAPTEGQREEEQRQEEEETQQHHFYFPAAPTEGQREEEQRQEEEETQQHHFYFPAAPTEVQWEQPTCWERPSRIEEETQQHHFYFPAAPTEGQWEQPTCWGRPSRIEEETQQHHFYFPAAPTEGQREEEQRQAEEEGDPASAAMAGPGPGGGTRGGRPVGGRGPGPRQTAGSEDRVFAPSGRADGCGARPADSREDDGEEEGPGGGPQQDDEKEEDDGG